MVIASLALMFLNIYSASNTRELMFQAKYASVQDKIQVVASSFETADTLSTETVDQVISVLGDINVSRLLITDAEGKVLYDSSINQNAVGKYALLEAVAQALGVNVIHFGMIVSIANVVGTMTPPVAVNIFSAASVTKLSMGKIVHGQWHLVHFCCKEAL